MTRKGRNPRASLVVLAYNNGRFIGEAIAGAFGQTYPDLEVILSDDCSTDGTFERIRAAAATYSGPHQIKINRTPANSGTVAHLYHAVGKSTGELIVLAAGDDLSYPERVEKLVTRWQETGAYALFSAEDLIDEAGTIVARGHSYDSSGFEWNDYFRDFRAIRGATSAYDRRTFVEISPPNERILFEDTYLSLMLHLYGRPIVYLDEPLVQYRSHPGAITNADFSTRTMAQIVGREVQAQTSAASIAALLREFRRNLGSRQAPPKLDSDIAFYDFRSRWVKASPAGRLKALGAAKRMEHARWIAGRLLGPKPFALLKACRAPGDIKRSVKGTKPR